MPVRTIEGELIFVNEALCRMLGYSEDELLGHKVAEFLTSESVNAYQEETGRRSAGQDSEYELTWKRKDRTEVATHVSATFFGEEDVEVAFAIITDLTKLELGQIDKSFRVLQRVRNDTVAIRLCEELPDDLKNTMKMKIIDGLVSPSRPETEGTVKEEAVVVVPSARGASA